MDHVTHGRKSMANYKRKYMYLRVKHSKNLPYEEECILFCNQLQIKPNKMKRSCSAAHEGNLSLGKGSPALFTFL